MRSRSLFSVTDIQLKLSAAMTIDVIDHTLEFFSQIHRSAGPGRGAHSVSAPAASVLDVRVPDPIPERLSP